LSAITVHPVTDEVRTLARRYPAFLTADLKTAGPCGSNGVGNSS
jgi:hypothetical protein